MKVSLFLLINLGVSQISFADEDSPYSFEAVYTVDYFENIDGGIKEGSAYMDSFDVIFDIDAEKLWGISGASFHVHVLHNNSQTFSDLVGDAKVVSSIENTSMIRLYEMWWQQNTGNHSIKFGLYDLNSSDLLIAIEANYAVNNTRFGFGTWNYTKETEYLDTSGAADNSGIYGIIQHQFFISR